MIKLFALLIRPEKTDLIPPINYISLAQTVPTHKKTPI